MSRWFRFYDTALDDPKVQRLPAELFKTWVNLLCVASRHNGKLPDADDLAFMLRLDGQTVRQQLERLESFGLIDRNGVGTASPHNWEQRQFQSDTSVERTRRYRERHKNKSETPDGDGGGDGHVTSRVTPPDTDTETETDQNKAPETDVSGERASVIQLPIHEKRRPEKRAHRLPDDFTLTPDRIAYALKEGLSHAEAEREFEKFTTYHGSKGNRFVDWGLAWQTWVRNAVDRFGGHRRSASGGHGNAPGGRFGAMQRALARLAHSDPVPE